jgi:CBS domain-containing protein
MADTARDLMTEGAECIGERETVAAAAQKLAQLDVGAVPICGEDDKLKGIITDRDIAVKVVAQGRDPQQTTAGELAEGVPTTVTADDSVETVVAVMTENKVRRLPVLDSDKRLVGIVSQADIATKAEPSQTAQVVQEISAAP